MTFKPTIVTTPQPEKVLHVDRMAGELNSQPEGGAPGTGQPGDPGIAPLTTSMTGEPESVNRIDQYATGDGYAPAEVKTPGGEPGPAGGASPLTPPRAFGLHTTQAQEQTVKDDRGVVTTFLSDLPQK